MMNAEKKTRTHRMVIRNITATDSVVREQAMDELGIEIEDWRVEDVQHFKGLVAGGGLMPQRNTNVIVFYKE